MKNVSIVLLIVMVSMASCAKMQQKEMVKESRTPSFQPKPLDDEWSKWLAGKWQSVSVHSDFLGGELEGVGESNEEAEAGYTIEPCLNGQFLLWKSWAEGEMTDEQEKQIKDAFSTYVSDEELERFLSMPGKELDIQTIDPKTGERIAYAFDSQRLYGQGRGRLEGNKEIMEWEFSGIGRGLTGVSIMERINDNIFTYSMKYTLPKGDKMEEKLEFTRKKIKTEKKI